MNASPAIMKRLYLMRHAEAEWGNPSQPDHSRPLSERGRRAAPLAGRRLAQHGQVPGVIVSSPATRARETAELLDLSPAAGIRFDGRIYEASPETLREVASGLHDAHSSAMIVGHNPGMEGFIGYLTGRIEPMPTAAVAVIDLDLASWRKIGQLSGSLVTVMRPDPSHLTLP